MNTPESPEFRIRVMDRSLRCFAGGVCGLIPLLGVPEAMLAFLYFWETRAAAAAWPENPARHYRRAGFVFAILGTLVSVIISAIFLVVVLQKML